METKALECKANEIRKDILKIIYNGKAGHMGGDLSAADIFVALYYEIMRIDPGDPGWDKRDRFVLSKGHCVEGYYAVLADKGFIGKDELNTYMRFGTRLLGHPTNKVPGIEINTGALGHGLSNAAGMAIGLKMDDSDSRVFVLMGDGEQAEGSIWEAAMAASHYRLDNLTGIIDRNRLQISGCTEDVMCLEPLAQRWSAFGWSVREIDGNNMDEIVKTLKETPFESGKPSLVIANTIKGRGVKQMEGIAKWHHGVPDQALYEDAMSQLNKKQKELEQND